MADTTVRGINCCRGTSFIDEPVVRLEVHSGWNKGWLARITAPATEGIYDLDREFVSTGERDVSRAGNGKITFALAGLADGIYEADSVYRSYKGFRAFFRIEGESVVEIFDNKQAAKKALGAGEREASNKPAKKPSSAAIDPRKKMLLEERKHWDDNAVFAAKRNDWDEAFYAQRQVDEIDAKIAELK